MLHAEVFLFFYFILKFLRSIGMFLLVLYSSISLDLCAVVSYYLKRLRETISLYFIKFKVQFLN